MAKVSFKITDTENFSEDKSQNKPSYVEGQIIFVEGLNKIYLDFHNKRTCYTPDTSSGINYLGIVDEEPTTKEISIDGETITARLKDVVVYGKKEYMWRKEKIKDSDGHVISTTEGWYEIGDEDSPTWNI